MTRISGILVAMAAGAAIAAGSAGAPTAVAEPSPAPPNCKLYPECLWEAEGSTWPGVENGDAATVDNHNHDDHDEE